MTHERVAEARALSPAWSAQTQDAFRTRAEVLGVPVEDGLCDPTTLLPHVAAGRSGPAAGRENRLCVGRRTDILQQLDCPHRVPPGWSEGRR